MTYRANSFFDSVIVDPAIHCGRCQSIDKLSLLDFHAVIQAAYSSGQQPEHYQHHSSPIYLEINAPVNRFSSTSFRVFAH